MSSGYSNASELKGIHLFGLFQSEFYSLDGKNIYTNDKYYEVIEQDWWETKESNPEFIRVVITTSGIEIGEEVCFEIDVLFGDLIGDTNGMLDFDESIRQAKWQSDILRRCKKFEKGRMSNEPVILELGEFNFDDLNSRDAKSELSPFRLRVRVKINGVEQGKILSEDFKVGD